MTDYISEDNLALILRWLPVKTILQFRCVCKGWKNTIDSPFFTQQHLTLQKPRFLCQNEGDSEYLVLDPNDILSFYRAIRLRHPFQVDDSIDENRLNDQFQGLDNENRLHYLYRDDDCFDDNDLFRDNDYIGELDYPIDDDFSFGWSHKEVGELDDRIDNDFWFLGTHNGVVCLIDSTNSNLLVWNPSIRKSLTVSIPNYHDCRWEYIEDYSCLGFWIDPLTKEFKIILLTCTYNVNAEDAEDDEDDEDGEPAGALYSSTQKEWRVIPLTEVRNWARSPPVMIQNVAHWIGNKTEDDAHVIISFDFILERFDIIEMPALNYRFSSIGPMLCHWQGNLTVGARDGRYSHRYNIYMRQEGLWVKMFDFNLSLRPDKVLWVLGEEEGVRVLIEGPHHLVLYDPKQGGEGIIHSPDEDSDEDYYMDGRAIVYGDAYVAYDFLETLIFP